MLSFEMMLNTLKFLFILEGFQKIIVTIIVLDIA